MSQFLVTGGVGFIGSNLAMHLACQGHTVRVFDNFSRPGVEENARWLEESHGNQVEIIKGDVRTIESIIDASEGCDAIFHLAGQVAVTTSIQSPHADFECNLMGTVNVLETARRSGRKMPVIYASTNKVYGDLAHIPCREEPFRYVFSDGRLGVNESAPLEFQTPYACSKGAGDQYVMTYGRVYDVPTVVLRMSCIYGDRQFGTEDQGWVAHFVAKALRKEAIVIYGDGKQVRDILFVTDVVRAYEKAFERADLISGTAINVGGGPANSVSLLELLLMLEKRLEIQVKRRFAPWRQEDQKIFISNIEQARERLGWYPVIDVQEGLARMIEYTQDHIDWFV